MNNKNGIILPLAWPEGLVPSNHQKYDRYMSWFNLCKNGFYKVGHAAMLLVNTDTGEVYYYDFGRYIAEPRRYGRIRSVKTDAELVFTISAECRKGEITNLDEILKYTASHPHTHGKGKLYAGLCRGYHFEEVYDHIERQQSRGLIKYGAFTIGGTNCSRFVAQTMAAFSNVVDKVKILYPWYGTPSPLGNIFKSHDRQMYVVENGHINKEDVSQFSKQFSVLKNKILFNKHDTEVPHIKESRKGAFQPKKKPEFLTAEAQWIGGVGAGAWHELLDIQPRSVRFRRTQENGHIDIEETFHGTFPGTALDAEKGYEFLPGTTCAKLLLRQNGQDFIYLPVKSRQLAYSRHKNFVEKVS